MSELTLEQVFNRYQDGEIDKATAINYLKILNLSDTKYRENGEKILFLKDL
ncbi:MAG: hypothetical protein ACFFAN_05925 [Promethearchaeota archaeon]